MIEIRDYSLFRKDRKGRGGGALLFIRSFLRPKQKIQLKHDGTPLTDVVTSTIGVGNATLNILCVYRSPRSTREQDATLLEILQDLTSKKGESLILGDFNAPVIDWHARSCSAIGSFSDHLLEFAETGQLFQGITFPTRFRAGTSPSILDLLQCT